MKKYIKRIISALTGLALAAGVAAYTPVNVRAEVYAPESVTLYAAKKDYAVSFDVSDIPAGSEIDVSSVKSSDTSVAVIHDVGSLATNDEYSSGQAMIFLTVKKFGKTTVSYKIGKKTYKTNVTIEKSTESSKVEYPNPLDSITVSGVNGDKNFASKFDKSVVLKKALKLSESQSKGVIKIKTKPGWNVDSIDFYSSDKDGQYFLTICDFEKESVTIDGLNFKKADGYSYSAVISFIGKNGDYSCISFKFK